MNKILDKIHALLQRTEQNGASQAEAIEAAKIAQRLMAKYHVELTDFEEISEDIDEISVPITRHWNRDLAVTIAANTCCECLVKRAGHKSAVVFFGKETDRKTAASMFKMFLDLIKKGAAKTKRIAEKQYGNVINVESVYAIKYITAVEEELGKQCRALSLVPSEDVIQEFHNRFPDIRDTQPSRRFSPKYNIDALRLAAEKGYKDGQNAAMRRSLRGA